MSEIAEWYSNKSAFVTGATGFVGKCLVEKLLHDCPDIGTIYIIIRSKKGVSFEQRKLEYKNHVVFSRLKELNPKALDKIHIVQGDICESNLGMSDTDRKLIGETASLIFHSAADVRFDRPLIDAYNTNVRGSQNVLDFATEFKHLLAFVLVSTAYSQTHELVTLEERHYESEIRPELVQRFIDNIDPDVLDVLTPKILGRYPNTYGFTKGLVEQLVYDYSNRFPIAVARPPIIVTAWKEPLIGYTEGIHGINGRCLASGRGVLRSMMCNGNYPCNVMPADVIANGIIVLGYERGKRQENRLNEQCELVKEGNAMEISKQFEEPLYFNITEEHPMSWNVYLEILHPNYLKFPFDLALWYPGGSFKTNRLHNFICVLLCQLLPSILVDFLLILFGHPPILLKVQRLVVAGCDLLEYYLSNLFIFKADNYNEAYGRLNDIDREKFYNRASMNAEKYMYNAAYGTRLYLAKEKVEDIPKARRFYRYLLCLDYFTKTLFGYWIVKQLLFVLNISVF